MRRLAASFSLALLTLAAAPSFASAQVSPDVSAAREAALAGNFDRAQAALDGALGRTDLTREDLLANYEARVFISFANGDTDAMRGELERIAALDPNHAFDSDYFPTDVTDVFRGIVQERAGQLAVEAEAVALASGEFEVRGEARNDPGDLASEVRVYGRGAGDEWTSGSGAVRVDPGGASSGEYYAEAVGPGGAIVAREGSQGAPLSLDLAAEGATAAAGNGGGVPVWVWIAGAGVLVAAAVIIIVVAATSGGVSDDTQPTGPMVRFSMM